MFSQSQTYSLSPYSNAKGGEQPHELHDKYVHPSAYHDPKIPSDPRERESRKQRMDKEIEAEEREILKRKNESQSKKMPAKE
ncbi:9520_t:CDS:2 [Gigaspora margarita]|uniref:9520_t:CDS:1 n=1 Tax=Gigaspora margarita TaxID=4874 RepID=A0ABN7VF98_GIGMA|nr:9520_t:CDS:2 [Gigaspora margarita]